MRHVVTPLNVGPCRRAQCQVPASPQLIAQLHARFLSLKADGRLPPETTWDSEMKVDITIG